MVNTLTFAGVNLFTAYGVYISGSGTFSAPEREYTFYNVPARDGSVLGIGTRLNNIQVSYPAFIKDNFETNIAGLRSFLLSTIGYARLEDTYHQLEYREAVYEGAFDPDISTDNKTGKFTLTFNCKPQRWLKSGENAITITASTSTITNPTLFPSKPLIKFNGAGSITFGGVNIQVETQMLTDGYNFVYVDCETMNAYNGTDNLNKYVSFRDPNSSQYGMDAPKLVAGANTITKSGTYLTSVEITPRWYEV